MKVFAFGLPSIFYVVFNTSSQSESSLIIGLSADQRRRKKVSCFFSSLQLGREALVVISNHPGAQVRVVCSSYLSCNPSPICPSEALPVRSSLQGRIRATKQRLAVDQIKTPGTY